MIYNGCMTKVRVLIVSNRLPINLIESDGQIRSERSIGGVATAIDSVAKRVGARWMGWTGLKRLLSEEELAQINIPKKYIPIEAGSDMIRGYYDRFSNRFLWPVLHGKHPSFTPNDDDWAAYQSMNRRFATKIAEVTKPEDVIWIHDYHLMLVPAYLREMGLQNRIGFFLHVPFPRPQYWLRRPYARALTESIAQADVIGVQTKHDVINLKKYAKSIGTNIQGDVQAFPIGVDYENYHAAAKRPVVRRLQRAMQTQADGKKIIFSLSRLDYTKGILTQLQAVKRFFAEHKQPQSMVYKLVVAPSREHLPEYTQLSKEITQAVDSINASLGNLDWQPIDYEHRTIGFEEATAWYNISDLLLLLPSADGMNLIAKEYVASRQNDDGMAVLSTAMGAAEQLNRALLVPPDDAGAAASALKRAFRMGPIERPKRWLELRSSVQNQDIFWWADSFLAALAASGRNR